jgi:hypothetical protein
VVSQHAVVRHGNAEAAQGNPNKRLVTTSVSTCQHGGLCNTTSTSQ